MTPPRSVKKWYVLLPHTHTAAGIVSYFSPFLLLSTRGLERGGGIMATPALTRQCATYQSRNREQKKKKHGKGGKDVVDDEDNKTCVVMASPSPPDTHMYKSSKPQRGPKYMRTCVSLSSYGGSHNALVWWSDPDYYHNAAAAHYCSHSNRRGKNLSHERRGDIWIIVGGTYTHAHSVNRDNVNTSMFLLATYFTRCRCSKDFVTFPFFFHGIHRKSPLGAKLARKKGSYGQTFAGGIKVPSNVQ